MSQNKSSQSKRSQKNQRRKSKGKRKASRKTLRSNKQIFNRALNQFFDSDDIFSQYQFHGNIKWTAIGMAKMALLFSWSEKPNVTDAFVETLRRSKQLSLNAVHTTYQGFMGALTNYAHIFVPLMILRLQSQMKNNGGRFWEISGFVPIAFDGSRSSAARTRSNERALCSAAVKRKVAASPSTVNDPKPQAWITMMWHMGLRLPWDWRLGPSDSSERNHVEEMLAEGDFPKNTLFCGDAGFVGYPLWSSIMDKGYDFLVRVGSNVKLIHNDDGYVLSWPHDRQKKNERPLKLRLVRVMIGETEVHLLTSVLSESCLSEEAMIALYKKRWGVEIEFRGLKQTLNGRKLRCRNADRVYTELNWSILAMAIAELLAVQTQIASMEPQSKYTPANRSLSNTMRAIYGCLDQLHERVSSDADLFSQLERALTDNYDRKASKKARFRPKVNDKKKKKMKPPKIRSLDPDEIKLLEKLNPIETQLAA